MTGFILEFFFLLFVLCLEFLAIIHRDIVIVDVVLDSVARLSIYAVPQSNALGQVLHSQRFVTKMLLKILYMYHVLLHMKKKNKTKQNKMNTCNYLKEPHENTNNKSNNISSGNNIYVVMLNL